MRTSSNAMVPHSTSFFKILRKEFATNCRAFILTIFYATPSTRKPCSISRWWTGKKTKTNFSTVAQKAIRVARKMSMKLKMILSKWLLSSHSWLRDSKPCLISLWRGTRTSKQTQRKAKLGPTGTGSHAVWLWIKVTWLISMLKIRESSVESLHLAQTSNSKTVIRSRNLTLNLGS